MRLEELVGWVIERGYREDFVREQMERVSNLDRNYSFIRKVNVIII